jgi:CheY-like chemotaxis protein
MALTGGAAASLQKPINRAQLRASLASIGLQPVEDCTRRVLVVEDDPNALEAIAEFLPAPAYEVVRANGGREAITLAERVHPDLILLDLMVSDVNGFDVVEALRKGATTADIPIVVVTAKQINGRDGDATNDAPGDDEPAAKKSSFSKEGFISEVRRALGSQKEDTDGDRTDH